MNTQDRARMADQRGISLIMALVFLLIFAVMAASMFRSSLTSVQAIGNMQNRDQVVSAANDAIDKLLSNTDFANKYLTIGDDTAKTPYSLDVDGDGSTDIKVSFVPEGAANGRPHCLRLEPIPNSNLNQDDPADIPCMDSNTSGNSGLAVATAGGGVTTVTQNLAKCSNTEWTLAMRATDQVTNASADVVQGVGVRVRTSTVTACD